MLITKFSPVSKQDHTLDLDITQEQLDLWNSSRTPVQNAFPNLTADEREFLISGILPHEWEELFPPEEPTYEEKYTEYPENFEDLPF